MHVVKGQPDSIISHRIDLDDCHTGLAANTGFLVRAVALHLRTGAFNAQIFGRQLVFFASIKRNIQ